MCYIRGKFDQSLFTGWKDGHTCSLCSFHTYDIITGRGTSMCNIRGKFDQSLFTGWKDGHTCSLRSFHTYDIITG